MQVTQTMYRRKKKEIKSQRRIKSFKKNKKNGNERDVMGKKIK